MDGRQRAAFTVDRYDRALLRPAADAEAYLQAALSGPCRKKLRRNERRLAELGRLQYVALESGGDVGAWTEEFLRLEASGWKGRAGSAMACAAAARAFFTAVAAEAFRRGRLMMLALRLDGRPIAQLCNFVSGRGSFAFKVAFDEAYAPFSPGVLLEAENIRRFHDRPDLGWMDSCAAMQPALVDRLWTDRRLIETVLVDTGRAPGAFLVSCFPLLRWLRRRASSVRSWSRLPPRRPAEHG